MATNIVFEDFSDGSINVTDPSNPVWQGTGVFDQLMMAVNGNIQAQFDAGRIKGSDYANVYMNSMQAAMSESMKFVLTKKLTEKQVDLVDKQVQSQDVQIAIGEVQLAENSEKWQIQKQVLQNQLEMSNVDVSYKAQNAAKDLEIKTKQVESATADIAFNTSKKTIMEQTRKDNIRSKAAEQFAEFMKYISAANVVPGPTDFQNMRGLITAMNNGISNPDSIATLTTSGADYVKP
jgi:hypothetical protein